MINFVEIIFVDTVCTGITHPYLLLCVFLLSVLLRYIFFTNTMHFITQRAFVMYTVKVFHTQKQKIDFISGVYFSV